MCLYPLHIRKAQVFAHLCQTSATAAPAVLVRVQVPWSWHCSVPICLVFLAAPSDQIVQYGFFWAMSLLLHFLDIMQHLLIRSIHIIYSLL